MGRSFKSIMSDFYIRMSIAKRVLKVAFIGKCTLKLQRYRTVDSDVTKLHNNKIMFGNYRMVPAGGLEPPRLAPTDFESVMSTIPSRRLAKRSKL